MSKKIYSSLLMLMALAITASAATIDDAKKLYNDGHYYEAIANLQEMAKKAPKDAAIQYYLGASYYEIGDLKNAIAHLQKAEDAKWPVAAQKLAEIYLSEYDIDAANEHLDKWEQILDKAKKPYPEELDMMRERQLTIRNFMDRVEKVNVIEAIQVDSVEFFKNYMLSSDAGELIDGDQLPDQYSTPAPKVVYRPQSGKELFWGMTGDNGKTQVVVADVLDDGMVDQPMPLGNALSDGGESDFPFVLQDGVTIYYGATGEGSLGGYDIFMTRRSPDGSVLQPQNIGMPYNSPDNDFMMAIDETKNIGWWASDREHIPGKVTIYKFVPSKMRINHDPDSPGLRDAALLRNVKHAEPSEGIPMTDEYEEGIIQADFYFPMPNGAVYTHIEQFRNGQARQAMKEYTKRLFELETMEAQLEELRMAYAKGDKKVAPKILALEEKIKEAPAALERLSNQVITLETRR